MRKCGVVLSHNLNDYQIKELKSVWSIVDIVYIPDDLRKGWSSVDPFLTSVSDCCADIISWISKTFVVGDYIIVQGDYGTTFLVVNFAINSGLIPLYATTEREVIETTFADGSIKTERIFKHAIFRKYL